MELGARGARLWESLLARDVALQDDLNPLREVALSACRAADRADRLEELAVLPAARSILVETRLQEALLAGLVASLRLPNARGKRPQRRTVRGFHRISG